MSIGAAGNDERDPAGMSLVEISLTRGHLCCNVSETRIIKHRFAVSSELLAHAHRGYRQPTSGNMISPARCLLSIVCTSTVFAPVLLTDCVWSAHHIVDRWRHCGCCCHNIARWRSNRSHSIARWRSCCSLDGAVIVYGAEDVKSGDKLTLMCSAFVPSDDDEVMRSQLATNWCRLDNEEEVLEALW